MERKLISLAVSDIVIGDDKMTSVNISITPLSEENEPLNDERKSILGMSTQNDVAVNDFITAINSAIDQLMLQKGV